MALPSPRFPSRHGVAPASPDAVVRALARFYRPPETSWQLAVNGNRPDDGDAPGDEIQPQIEVDRWLQSELVWLSGRDRLVLFLSFGEGWSLERIARRLEISPTQCRTIRDLALAGLAARTGLSTDHETPTESTPGAAASRSSEPSRNALSEPST